MSYGRSFPSSVFAPFFVLVLVIAGCDGGDRDGRDAGVARDDGGRVPSGADGGGGGGEYWCCIDGAYYECPGEAEVIQCSGGFDLFGCLDRCGFDDFGCMDDCYARQDMTTPDPSACARDAALDGTCDTPSAGCREDPAARACDVDADCDSSNCVNGGCYPNTVGSLCDVDADCDSSNCVEGCCYANDEGSPCDVDADCDSSNCHDGECHGNGFGDGCDVDADCDSSGCTDHVCR